MSRAYDVVVAGGGIAGLTAGLTSARLGRSTLVLAGDVLGGNLLSIEKVEGYPGFPEGVPGYELCPAAQAMAAEAGADFEMLPLLRVEPGLRLFTAEGEIGARALIVATGASPSRLGVPGEKEYVGKGVSHCASCDAPLLHGKIVAVVGGGDSAMQEALTLARHVSKIILLCRGGALGGQETYRSRVAAEPKIEVRFNAEVEEILGDIAVTGVRLRGEAGVLDAAAVFTYIGLQANTAFLSSVVRLDSSKRIPTDAAMATSMRGIFAAGLARAGSPGRAVASAGEGAAAAAAAHRYLQGDPT